MVGLPMAAHPRWSSFGKPMMARPAIEVQYVTVGQLQLDQQLVNDKYYWINFSLF